MKKLLTILFSIMLSSAALAQDEKLEIILKRLSNNPNTNFVRTPALDSAAACQARFIAANHRVTHFQPAGSGLEIPRKRVQKYGDTGSRCWYEVAWGAPVGLTEPGNLAAVYGFKESAVHWDILTDFADRDRTVKVGFARLIIGNYEACIIVYAY